VSLVSLKSCDQNRPNDPVAVAPGTDSMQTKAMPLTNQQHRLETVSGRDWAL